MSASTTDPLFHILSETTFLIEHSAGLSQDDIWGDEVLKRAIVKSLEIIGEAANRLPSEVRQTYSHIQWRRMIDLRNVLIHNYDNVDPDKVWDVLVNYVPELRRNVQQIIENERSN